VGAFAFCDRIAVAEAIYVGASQSAKAFAFLRSGARPRAADAFEQRLVAIVSEHFDGAWLFARRLGVHEGDLDDVMQEVGAIVASRLEAITLGSEKSFVFGTVFRVASESRRRRARRHEVDEELALDAVDGAARPDQVSERREARELLDRLLSTMPLELRAVFVLFEIEERSQVEIAEILSLPVGTVASRMRRAREDFDARVARWQAQHGGPE
jgi:RNA polymerase sigma-70 factor, ECF subfamily